jgi:hypothetical protein
MIAYLFPLLVGLFVFVVIYFCFAIKSSKGDDTKTKELFPLFLWRLLVPDTRAAQG